MVKYIFKKIISGTMWTTSLLAIMLFWVSAGVGQEATNTPTPAPTETPSPTVTPTPTATPTGCEAARICMDQSVPAVADSCLSQNQCVVTKASKYATTAHIIAGRSISHNRCSRKNTRAACNVCYQRAKFPLKSRYDGVIFQGLLGQAVKFIEAERRETCSQLSRR